MLVTLCHCDKIPEEKSLKKRFALAHGFSPQLPGHSDLGPVREGMWPKGIVDGSCPPYCREKQKESVEQDMHFKAQSELLSGSLPSYRSMEVLSILEL